MNATRSLAIARTAVIAAGLAATALAACGRPGSRAVSAAEAHNEEVVRAFAQALNERDWGALDTLLTEDYARHSQATPGYEVRSRADFLAFAREDAEAFPDARLGLEQLVSEGDRVAFWGTYTGVQRGPMGVFPATGEEIRLDFSGIHRVDEGRVAETWVTWDNLTALVQLGHWEVRPPSEPPSPDAYCAVWVPSEAPAVEDAAGPTPPDGG